MSTVIVEVSSPAQTGGSTLVAAGTQKTSSTTSSGTSQSVKPTGATGSVVTVHNNGSDAIRVNFGAAATSAVGHYLAPNTSRDFGAYNGESINIINSA